jgi:general secretion pathway protein K
MAITRAGRRGSALLTVLWISAALSAVVFSLASTVRGETERVSTDFEGLRAYYLAVGAVERATVEMMWVKQLGDTARIPRGAPAVDYTFQTGSAHVEIIPEAARLDVNSIQPQQLLRMLAYMGVEPDRAQAITAGIIGRRTGAAVNTPFSTGPTFHSPAASFQEIEELLSVPGVTPEIMYGTYVPVDEPGEGEPRLVRRGGLADCLSAFGSKDRVDANSADPATLAAVGVLPAGIDALVRLRREKWLDYPRLGALMPMLGPGAAMLKLEGNSIFTIRATAGVWVAPKKLSEVRRTVAVQVKYMPKGYDSWIHILRWYDTAWSN